MEVSVKMTVPTSLTMKQIRVTLFKDSIVYNYNGMELLELTIEL